MPTTREQFIAQARQFLSTHLDHHHSAETTIELEIATLLIMIDVGRTSEHVELWREVIRIAGEYLQKAQADSGALLRALYQLADAHLERVSKQ